MVYVLLAEGFEEVEALTPVDLLRRAGVETRLVGVTGATVCGARGINVVTDLSMDEVDLAKADMLVLPGGMPGTVHLGEDDTVSQVIREFAKEGKLVAAICAAPSVLGQAGILNGKKAACHPGFEEKLTGAEVFFSPVVCDGNVITSRGMGTAVPFGLAVARYFTDDATIEHVKAGLVYA